MRETRYETPKGVIRYWLDVVPGDGPALVFLPGLTADHRLFDKQVEYFAGKHSLLVWDAPGHAVSWPFEIDCPALLICGTEDRAGSCKRYSRAWHRGTGIPLHWIDGAGHNANTDRPDIVNRLIEGLVAQIKTEDNP